MMPQEELTLIIFPRLAVINYFEPQLALHLPPKWNVVTPPWLHGSKSTASRFARSWPISVSLNAVILHEQMYHWDHSIVAYKWISTFDRLPSSWPSLIARKNSQQPLLMYLSCIESNRNLITHSYRVTCMSIPTEYVSLVLFNNQ